MVRSLQGIPRLMASLLYGSGLRLLECCRLRVQDVDFGTNQILVRGAKGDKDRITVLPAAIKADLIRHLDRVREQHGRDFRRGAVGLSFQRRSTVSTRTPGGSGSGSGCSRRRGSIGTA